MSESEAEFVARRLLEDAEVTRELPPIPYWDETQRARGVDLLRRARDIGAHIVAVELLNKTVNGATWTGARQENFRTFEIAVELFRAGALTVDEINNCLGSVAGAELRLAPRELGWWELHKQDVLRAFATFGVTADAYPQEHLIAMIGTESWDSIEGLASYGLSWTDIEAALQEYTRLCGIVPVPQWVRRS